MWEQITTLSEIDKVVKGTLLARENPDANNEAEIYRVIENNADNILMNSRISNDTKDILKIKADELFYKGWWMLKTD
jgi:hypothetical protein